MKSLPKGDIWLVKSSKAAGGVIVDKRDVVIWACPYFRFLIGKNLHGHPGLSAEKVSRSPTHDPQT